MDQLHRQLEKLLKQHLQASVVITPPHDFETWKGMASEEKIHFDMHAVEAADAVFAKRSHGRECEVMVLPVRPNKWWRDYRWWMSWQDKWKTKPGRRLELREAALAFFWGRMHDPEKDQILRAEWEDPPEYGKDAAQPHWHIDPGRLVPRGHSQPQARLGGRSPLADLDSPLEELSDSTSMRRLDTARLHLGMAGWELTDIEDNCWQRRVADDLGRLLKWADETLYYTIRQLRETALAKG